MGFIFSLLAGIAVSIQSVFNARVSEKIGLWETNTIVHGTGLIVTFLIFLLTRKGDFKKLNEVNKLYLLGGTLGVVIIFSVMKGISLIGTTLSISVMIVTQLIFATLIDSFGLFGATQIKFHFTKPLGVIIMIIGILIFKLKG